MIRMRVKHKGRLIASKTVGEEDFQDYIALAGTVAKAANAPDNIVKDIISETHCITARIMMKGKTLDMIVQKVKDKDG